jgi:hypothetical protein
MSWLSTFAMALCENTQAKTKATHKRLEHDARLSCITFLLESTWSRVLATAKGSPIRRRRIPTARRTAWISSSTLAVPCSHLVARVLGAEAGEEVNPSLVARMSLL